MVLKLAIDGIDGTETVLLDLEGSPILGSLLIRPD